MKNCFDERLAPVCRNAGKMRYGGTSARVSRSARGVLGALAVLVGVGGCASRKAPAPVVNLNTAQVAAHTAAGTYTVRTGDTLFSIARSFNTSVAELVRLNDLLDPNHLWAGQVLHLRDNLPAPPAQTPPAQTARATPAKADAKPATQPAAKPPASKPATTSATTPAAPAKPPAPRPAPPVLAWGWPAQGNLIGNFSASTKGIDIAGKAGEPVLAAAAGTVRYEGNGVRGLGYLVLIEHGNDFMTAYAHNQKLLVTVGQQVKKGERIALLGMSDTTSPRLHFEIRRNGTPVNPLNYLPKK